MPLARPKSQVALRELEQQGWETLPIAKLGMPNLPPAWVVESWKPVGGCKFTGYFSGVAGNSALRFCLLLKWPSHCLTSCRTSHWLATGMATKIGHGRHSQSAQKWKCLRRPSGRCYEGDNLPALQPQGPAVWPEKEEVIFCTFCAFCAVSPWSVFLSVLSSQAGWACAFGW